MVQIDPDYVPAPDRAARTCSASPSSRAATTSRSTRRLLDNIVTENKDTARGGEARHDRGPHHPEVHPVQLGVLRQGRPGHRRGRRPAEPHPLHPPGGQQGRQLVSCASIPRCWACPSWTASAAPTGTTPSTSTSRDECEDVLRRRRVAAVPSPTQPEPLTARGEEGVARRSCTGVTVGSDAFFPFGDNVERARKSGVQLHRRARRLHPRRPRHRDLQQVRHRHGLHRHAPVPSLIGRLGPCLGPKVSVVEPFAAALSRAAVLRHNG